MIVFTNTLTCGIFRRQIPKQNGPGEWD